MIRYNKQIYPVLKFIDYMKKLVDNTFENRYYTMSDIYLKKNTYTNAQPDIIDKLVKLFI